MSAHNLCFEQQYEKMSEFLSENFQFWEVKFSKYLNRHVFVMVYFSFDLSPKHAMIIVQTVYNQL